MADSVADRLGRLIASSGPIPVSTYLEHALYGVGGFYTSGGRAGRRGDFLTSPEVGPLFGAVMAGALEAWWREQGEPRRFDVLEWGAGPGTLARATFDALPDVAPALAAADAVHWTLIEIGAVQRELHPQGAHVTSVGEWRGPAVETGVVLANELLDNLPFDIVRRTRGGWNEIRLTRRDRDPERFVEVEVGLGAEEAAAVDAVFAHCDVAPGTRLPLQRASRSWLAAAGAAIERGRITVFDYGGSTAELAARDGGWLRTHAVHDDGADWLVRPGSCDITADVDLDQLQADRPADHVRTQADWLVAHGIERLVAEGRARWEAAAGVGDLAALKARSRIREAEALTDPGGMGAFTVLEWVVGK